MFGNEHDLVDALFLKALPLDRETVLVGGEGIEDEQSGGRCGGSSCLVCLLVDQGDRGSGNDGSGLIGDRAAQ